jgi:uracil-DNA glycosylase family 4
MSSAKQKRFQMLCKTAQACKSCPNLRERTAVLSELNGNINAEVMFIAEAPGRNGGNRTRIPFSGDNSGRNFQALLDSINLKREEIFITNSALCNPHTRTGANRKPTKKEIRNCSDFLRNQIEIIQPKIIVTLGAVALEALKSIEDHQFSLRENAASVLNWNGVKLIPLYHPSPQVVASHRRMNQQLEDFQVLRKEIPKVG